MRLVKILAALLAIAVIVLPVRAQDEQRPQRPQRGQRQPMGQRLTDEQAKAVWELQAATMAKGLELSDENTATLGELYFKARQSHAKGMDDLRAKWREANRGDGEGQDPPDRRGGGQRGGRRGMGAESQEEMAKLADAEREKLRTGLKAFLEGRQLEYATEVLGSFNPGWDNMVHAVSELKLDKEKAGQALKVIEAHIAETVVLRRSGDRQGQRQAQAAARAKLTEKMKAILDEEQFAQFQQAMGGQRGARMPGGGMASRFEQWDTNGDGMLQKEELPEQLQQAFERLDANGDGALDEEELQAMGRGRGGQQRGGGQRGRGGGGGDGF